jgi:outer membrane protein
MKLLKFAFLFFCVTTIAQSKVGTIDIDFIIGNMPELSGVQKQVTDYTASLDADLQKQQDVFGKEMDAYKINEDSMTIKQKQDKQKAIMKMESDMNKFRQNGSQLITIKSEEFMAPLYDKIGKSIEKVAAEQKYTQILRRENTVYVDSNYDLTLAVLKDLGIEIKEGK